MASHINAALYSGRRTADRDRYDSNVRKAYRQRVEQQGEKTEEKQSGNLLTKFADMVSLPQQMEQAANLQMYGNESTKKLGEVLDTRNEEKIANAKDEISYVAERGAVGAADKLEGAINALGYMGQALSRTQQLQNSQDAAMWGAVTGSDTQNSLSQRLEQAALKSSREGLKDTVTFGDDLRADVERRHANSNISKMGRVAADVSEAAGGLLPSVAVNLIAPGSGLAANAVNAISAAGNAVQEAKKSGADDLRAAGYGLATGGIEFATEKVVDGLSGLFGRGALDDIIENAVEKYLTNQTAKRVVTAAGSAFGEGAEEFISEIGGRLANEWLINTDDRSFRETLKDGLYSGLIGMLLSGGTQAGGSVVNAARTNTSTPVSTASQADYTPYLEQLKQLKKDRQQHTQWLASIGAQDTTLSTLAKYEKAKYNNSPEYQLLSGYSRAIEKGDISPLVGFAEYKHTSHSIQESVVGTTTATGVKIEGYATHFVDRMIGQTSTTHADMRCGVSTEDVIDALKNPVRKGEPCVMPDGDVRQKLYGRRAAVVISLRDKKLIQTHPRGE